MKKLLILLLVIASTLNAQIRISVNLQTEERQRIVMRPNETVILTDLPPNTDSYKWTVQNSTNGILDVTINSTETGTTITLKPLKNNARTNLDLQYSSRIHPTFYVIVK